MSQPGRFAPHQDSRFPQIQWLTVGVVIALAIWILGSTVFITRIAWVSIPITDDWTRWFTYVRDHYSLTWFYEQQVDHRLAFPKVLFAIDHLVFHARGWFTLACAYGLQALTGFMLWFLAGRAYPQDRSERLVQAALIVSCLFSSQQWVNFVMPFQVQFPMVYCAAAAALFALWRAVQNNASFLGWFVASIFLGIVATYSMANGILIWPVMIVAASLLGISRGRIVVLVVMGLLIAMSFFWNWQQSPLGHAPESHRVERGLLFGLAYLGSPTFTLVRFGNWPGFHLLLPTVPGAIAALALAAGLVLFWRHHERHKKAESILMLYCMFLGCSCAAIVVGRYAGPLSEAYQWRYYTPVYLLWVTFLLTAWPILGKLNRTLVYSVLGISIYAAVAAHQLDVLNPVREWLDSVRAGEASVADNVVDPDPWNIMFTPPELAADAVDYLKDHRLSIFAEEWTQWPGKRLDSRFAVDRDVNACSGQFDRPKGIASFRPGWRISGRAWDAKARRRPRYIILADDQGVIAGVGLPQFPSRENDASWMGYVNGQPRAITAFVLESNERSLCSIGRRQLPSLPIVTLSELSQRFPEAGVQMTGAWHKDGYYQGPDGPGIPSIDGPVFGSYPPDAGVGVIRLGPFHLDGHAGIAIPLVSGPDARSLSVEVRDSITQQVLARIGSLPNSRKWWAWHPDLPEGREITIDVFAEDRGTGWGQWIALAWPHKLRQ